MRHLFEDGVYFVGGLHRVRHLFEGGVYSRAVSSRVNTVVIFRVNVKMFSSIYVNTYALYPVDDITDYCGCESYSHTHKNS